MSNWVFDLTINGVEWIASPREGEGGVTRRILEDLEPALRASGLELHKHEVQSLGDLSGILDRVAANASPGSAPLLHFDMHGSEDDGLEIGKTGEHLSWADLTAKLRAINVATENNLCVILASCFGFHAIKSVSLFEACPYCIMIGPTKVVTFGFLEDGTVKFYKQLLNSAEITSAYKQHLSPVMQMFNAEQALARATRGYIRDHTRGRAASERKERLLTEAIAQSPQPVSRNDRRRMRAAIKAGMALTQERFDRYAKTFLIGKPVHFELKDLKTGF